jgi:hypothetical protein
VRAIIALRERLDAAGDLPSLLNASRDAFSLIRAICRTSQERSDELSANFAVASASALHGRNVLAAAPSMPPASEASPLRSPPENASLEYDLDEITGELAGLASALARALRRTWCPEGPAHDRTACHHAAAKAERIRDLLYPPRPAVTLPRELPRLRPGRDIEGRGL